MTERRTPQTAVSQPTQHPSVAGPADLTSLAAPRQSVTSIVEAKDAEVVDRRTGQRTLGAKQQPGEVGGADRPEPTRFGDWEVGGRCTDF